MTDSSTAAGGSRFQVDDLQVRVHDSPGELGVAAARNTAEVLRDAVRRNGTARVVLATGNSQLDFVAALAGEEVPWPAVTVFHMDEYVGIGAEHPASFRRWITERIDRPLRPGRVELVQGDAPDVAAECHRYQELLRAAPVDLVCMGIGENGHLAFNEPGVADFADREWVKVIVLDERSRRQQAGEGHFPDPRMVPERAVTVTIPALLSARHVQVVVPELRKAPAVRATLRDPVSPACPATILRRQPHATLWLDRESASLLDARPTAEAGPV